MLMRSAAKEYNWKLNYGGIALMWRRGCVIRSAFLGKIKEAYDKNTELDNLLLDEYFKGEIDKAQSGWRRVIAALIVAVLFILLSFSKVAPLKTDQEIGINTLEKIELGGEKQWISIRGQSKENPILLFLHGGPGSANLALLRTQCPDLEKHFVVVNWDQRGAGKTYSPTLDKNSLTIEQIVADSHELIIYLKNRFGVEKIYLMGFS